MVLNTVVRSRFELVTIKIFDFASLPASTDRLLSSLTTCKNFNVDHVMFLRLQFFIIIDARIEDQVARDRFFLFQICWKHVKLVSLVPAVKFKSKFITQVIHCLANEGTAV